MKINNKIIIFVPFIMILALAGCAGYSSHPLKRLSPIVPPHVQEQFLSFTYHVFTKADCLKFLDRDVLSKGYQPIHIGITNYSSHSYYFSLADFSIPCVPAFDVAQRVHTSTAKRIVGYGALGLFIWPFLIPAIIDGVGSVEANKNLDMDFANKSLEDQTLSPFSSTSGLIFVPKEYFNKQFSFILLDQENHERYMLTPARPRLRIRNSNLDYIKRH